MIKDSEIYQKAQIEAKKAQTEIDSVLKSYNDKFNGAVSFTLNNDDLNPKVIALVDKAYLTSV